MKNCKTKTITETTIEVVSIAGMSLLIKKLSDQYCRNDTLKEDPKSCQQSGRLRKTGAGYHRNIIKRRGGQHHRNQVVSITGMGGQYESEYTWFCYLL